MSYVTQETVWPQAVQLDDGIKSVISLFYQLADDRGPEAGARMASEVFTPDAKLVAGTGAFQGKEEISHCRDHAWGKIVARRHQIHKVFINDVQGQDLFLLGSVKMDFGSKETLETDFTAHVVVNAQSVAAGSPLLEVLQVFADSAPVMKAMKGN